MAEKSSLPNQVQTMAENLHYQIKFKQLLKNLHYPIIQFDYKLWLKNLHYPIKFKQWPKNLRYPIQVQAMQIKDFFFHLVVIQYPSAIKC